MKEQLVSVMLGALLGGVISSISFYYRSRIEVRSKVNTAIFHLLEVWSVLAMVKTLQSKKFSEKFLERLKFRFPQENLGPEIESRITKNMGKLIPLIVESQFSGRHLLEKYTHVITELAPIYPVQAYQLKNNQLLLKYLDNIDIVMSVQDVSETDDAFIQSFKNFANNDAMNVFEKDLRKLAKRARLFGFSELNKCIDSLKNRVNELPSEVFDQLIDQVLSPVVQEHYDRLGRVNPNNQSSQT